MQIICKLADIHILEYVKKYDWFWGKIPNIILFYHTTFMYLEEFQTIYNVQVSFQVDRNQFCTLPVSMVTY